MKKQQFNFQRIILCKYSKKKAAVLSLYLYKIINFDYVPTFNKKRLLAYNGKCMLFLNLGMINVEIPKYTFK